MRVDLTLIYGAVAAVSVVPSSALAQQTISQFRGPVPVFTERDLTELDYAVALSPEQAAAERAVAEAATTEASILIGDFAQNWLLKESDAVAGVTDEKERQKIEGEVRTKKNRESFELYRQVQEIELRALKEMQAVLTPSQIKGRDSAGGTESVEGDRGSGGWEEFEQWRRSLVTDERNRVFGAPASPRSVLSRMKLIDADQQFAMKVLRKYQRDVDPIAIATLAAREQSRTRQREAGSAPADSLSPVTDPEKIRQIRIRAYAELEKGLSAEGARQVVSARVGIELQELQPPSKNDFVKHLIELPSLSSVQKQAVRDLCDAADEASLQDAAKLLHQMDQAPPSDGTQDWKARQAKTFKTQMSIQKAAVLLLQDLQEVLTPDQLREFDLATAAQNQPGMAGGTNVADWEPKPRRASNAAANKH